MNSLENFDVDIEVKKQIDSGLAWSVLFVITVSKFVYNILTIVITNTVVDKSTDHAKPLSICKLSCTWFPNVRFSAKWRWKLTDCLTSKHIFVANGQYQILGAKSFNLKWPKIRFTFGRRDGKTILQGM